MNLANAVNNLSYEQQLRFVLWCCETSKTYHDSMYLHNVTVLIKRFLAATTHTDRLEVYCSLKPMIKFLYSIELWAACTITDYYGVDSTIIPSNVWQVVYYTCDFMRADNPYITMDSIFDKWFIEQTLLGQ
jgi:hypothetical protein